MKKLVIINGTMGTGKTTVSKILLNKLTPSVFLDGDWCWNMNPFMVTEENKKMVTSNIIHMLKSFLDNSSFEYIIFCWVIQQEEIFETILEPLKEYDFELYKISLICSEKALKERLKKDVEKGIRQQDVIDRSIERIPLYENMDTIKIDVSELSPNRSAEKIINIINNIL